MDTNTPHPETPVAPSTETASVTSPSPVTSTPTTMPPPSSSHDTPVIHPEEHKASSSGKKPSLLLMIIFLVVAFVGGLVLATWYFQYRLQQATTPKAAAKVGATAEAKTIIIGSDATAPPMESINKQGGLVGYDIDLAYRLGNEMGMKVEIKNIPWDNIFTALQNKKIDMIISSVTINDERKQKYAFSDAYINAGQVIVSRKDNPITSTAQLKGKKISVQKGTTCAEEAYKYTDANLVTTYDQFIDAATAVSKGTTDATICDLTLAKGFVNQYENLKITSDPFTNEYYGVVLRKDNTDLLKKVNDALSVLRIKGILTDLKQKWLD